MSAETDRFCHVPRASITSASPTTLTLPTHDLGAGAAWLTEQHGYRKPPFPNRTRGLSAQVGLIPLTSGPVPAPAEGQSSWMATPVMATGSTGRSCAPV